ncbi:MAG: hypothetical protein ACRBM6_07015 [Geminicoccales bacterium]
MTGGNSLVPVVRRLFERHFGADRLTLEEFSREQVPHYWADAQMNLGNVLNILGKRTSHRDHLEEMLDAMKNASEVHLKEAGQTHREAHFRTRIQEIKAAIDGLTTST